MGRCWRRRPTLLLALMLALSLASCSTPPETIDPM